MAFKVFYRFYLIAISVFICLLSVPQIYAQKYTLSGYLIDEESGEALIGASVFIPKINKGAVANMYGYYSLTVQQDTFKVVFSFIGYEPQIKEIQFNKDIVLNISLSSTTIELQEFQVIDSKARKNVESAQMGIMDIPIKQLQQLPVIGGEQDILKSIQLLPGVQSGSEGSAGYYVRGGGPDQNLILLDEAIVYNPFHLGGFLSVFNSDAIKNVTLIKGGFPANYGGRLSSILDISMKDGNDKKYHGEGGIGLIASRLTLEGPIIKNKSSFMISGRRTYFDLLLKPFLPPGEKFGYYFYDLNAKLNYKFSDKDRVFISGYFGKDVFSFSNNTDKMKFQVDWGNSTFTTRWNHLFNKKLFSNTTLIYNDYAFRISSSEDNVSIKLYSGIQDINSKIDFDYFPSPLHKVKFGANYTYHTFIPSAVKGKSEDIDFENKQKKYVHDGAIYLNDDITISEKTSLNIGLRAPVFVYKSTKYFGAEPRVSSKYSVNRTTALKAGYTWMNQFMHLVSNSSVGTPMDLWIPSSDIVKPQVAHQVAAGVFKNFKNDLYETSVEIYYKSMSNLIEYKEGAQIFFNDNIDKELTFGKGWSYGSEWFIHKREGRINGWIGYTLSWTNRQFDELNFGKTFPAKYDRRHDLSVVANYELNKTWSFSAIFVYGSGHSLTLPSGKFYIPATNWTNLYSWYSEYTSKNGYQLRPYNRMDLGIQYKKVKPKYSFTWRFDVYNLYNRRNPYFIYITQEFDERKNKEKFVAKQVSLFPVLPTVSINFSF